MYLAGARVHMIMGLGPLMDAVGVFHGVISGAGMITINFVSCREMLPDPDFYRECLQAAYDELEAATLPRPARKTARKSARKSAPKSAPKSARKKSTTRRRARTS